MPFCHFNFLINELNGQRNETEYKPKVTAMTDYFLSIVINTRILRKKWKKPLGNYGNKTTKIQPYTWVVRTENCHDYAILASQTIYHIVCLKT